MNCSGDTCGSSLLARLPFQLRIGMGGRWWHHLPNGSNYAAGIIGPCALCQGHQRKCAALTVIVGSQKEQYVAEARTFSG
jgi:hypothetical protein